jgi:flagellar assembly factor FliW
MTPTVFAPSVAAQPTFTTTFFGAIDAAAERVIVFADGLLGLPTCRRWTLMLGERAGTAWLQSLDHAALAFLMIDPFVAFDGFVVDLGAAELRRIDAAPDANLLVYAMVTVPAMRGEAVTANLQGPVVIDVETRRGMQVVLPDSQWGVNHAVPAHLLARVA